MSGTLPPTPAVKRVANRRVHFRICLATALAVAIGCLLPCLAQNAPSVPVQSTPGTAASISVFDVEAHAIPKFVEADYIDLSKIASISKFRSGEGHDYSDDFESCRSMKHYFKPRADIDWAIMKVFAPVTGVVVRLEEEWAGTKLDIQVVKFPAFIVSIFHVKLIAALRPGDKVSAGQILGSHIGKQTYSDIAVSVNTPKGRKLVSYFDVMSAVPGIPGAWPGINESRDNLEGNARCRSAEMPRR